MSAGGIELTAVTLTRGGRRILDRLTAHIAAGTTTAVTGPSGAGKSTLLGLIAGFEPPDEGTVTNPFPTSSTGVVLQAYGLIRLLTAAENVELALQSRNLPPAEVRQRAAQQLEQLGLASFADRRTDELSGGQQQRLATARALVIEPDLLIADELTSELDPHNRERTLQTVLALRGRGTTVVLATHDAAIAALCDQRIAVGAPSATDETGSSAARQATSRRALEEQQLRIRAQRQIVERETARLLAMQHALTRLREQTAPDDPF